MTRAVEADNMIVSIPAVKEKLDMLREVVDDNAEHLQQSKDADARTGHKTADTSFFGYKTHIAMTDERIVTAAVITSGERADGEQLETLIEKTRATGLEVKAVIGDAAYSSKSNLALAESKEDLSCILSFQAIPTQRAKMASASTKMPICLFVLKVIWLYARYSLVRKMLAELKSQHISLILKNARNAKDAALATRKAQKANLTHSV